MMVEEKTRRAVVQKRVATVIRRQQIIRAARKLIAKHGSEHVTVRRLAAEIGVAEGAIYRHFKSKKDILALLIEDVENTLLSELELDPDDSPHTLEGFEKIITSHMSGIFQRRGVAFQVIAEVISFRDKKLKRKVYSVVNQYAERIKAILQTGVKAGAIRKDIDLDAAGALFFGMTGGLVNNWTLSGYSFDLEQKYTSLWKLFRETVINHEPPKSFFQEPSYRSNKLAQS